MALYFFSYDLNNQKNYQKLYAELDRFNAVRILDSTWCFKRVNTSSEGLRDHFKSFVDNDDSFIVSEVTDWASRKTKASPNNLP